MLQCYWRVIFSNPDIVLLAESLIVIFRKLKSSLPLMKFLIEKRKKKMLVPYLDYMRLVWLPSIWRGVFHKHRVFVCV